jgi:hypothetical protein
MWIDLTTAALDDRVPGHAPVLKAEVFEEDGGASRSGIFVVVVFDLADGSRRAAGTYCSPFACRGVAEHS